MAFITLTDQESDSDPNFDPIPRVRNYGWNLNATLYRVKIYVQPKFIIGISIRIRQFMSSPNS